MRLAVLLFGFVAVSVATQDAVVRQKFLAFQSEHGKRYLDATEHEARFKIFKDNYLSIQEHNARSSWKKELNQFADLTADEFKNQHLGRMKTPKPELKHSSHPLALDKNLQLPDSVDWRDAGVITDPKNQGSCGSCWAFAATEQMESYVMLNNGTLPVLSAQHITSCTPNPLSCGGTGGCQGSIPQLAWNYVQLFGLASDDDYGYTSGLFGITGNCKYHPDSMDAMATCRGYETLPHNDMNAVMNHIANIGPLSVSVDASSWSFYGHGVFDSCSYDRNIEINHAVQLVGYGTDETEGDYWLVRNSWGRTWGENGYIRLKRESTVQCGTDSTPLMGTACVDDGNDVQTVCGMCGVLFDTSYPVGASLL